MSKNTKKKKSKAISKVKNFFTIYKYNINKIYDKIPMNNVKQFEFTNSWDLLV